MAVAATGFARRLRGARIRAHLTQAALADAVGVQPRVVQRWEAGEARPQPRNREALSRALREPWSRLDPEEGVRISEQIETKRAALHQAIDEYVAALVAERTQ